VYGAPSPDRKTEPLLERALAIQERTLGKDHVNLVFTLVPMARISAERGRYARAQRLLARSLSLIERAVGARHPFVAAALDELAASYQAQGLLKQAEPLRRRSLKIRKETLAEDDPELAHSLNELASLRAARGDLVEAVLLFRSALEISEWRLRRELLSLPATQLEERLRKLRAQDDRLYALVRRHRDHPDLERLALATALLRKGRSGEEAAEVSRAIARDLEDGDREAFEQLRALRTQMAAAPSRERAAELAARGDALEADLSQRSAPLRTLRALPAPGQMVEAVRLALPADAALVELVEHEDQEPGVHRPPRYLALVLTAVGGVHAVDLGPAAAIDQAATRLDRALSGTAAPYLEESQTLYALAVRPWSKLVAGARRVYLVPDGKLGLVSYAALHDGQRFIADEKEIVLLNSGRDLLPAQGEVPPGQAVMVFADPDYGGGGAPVAPLTPVVNRGAAPAARCVDLSRASWSQLPGARREAEAVKRFFPEAEVWLGAEATKSALMRIQGPRVLHIAAHGISTGDLASRRPGARGMVEVEPLAAPPAACPKDPLLRSGLVLARPPDPAARTGGSIATALELMGLDLWGTELVVLSACGTGRGDVERSQGVYGMRRAFQVAGAQTLVTSLWPVEDETTAELMEEFYRRLGEGRGRVAALHEAMLAVRARKPHPHFWAPFIVIGKDGPL
jgi:CHAT domain-containing protein